MLLSLPQYISTLGVDVTDSSLREDSSPSIAAAVALIDRLEITKYAGLVCAQAHREA